MNIIDRYLLRQFLKAFLICFVSLTGLYMVFDAFTNLESFIRSADKLGGLGRVLVQYYSCRAVLFFDRTNFLLVLVAAMFTVTWIQRHNELTALMSAGISRVRVIRPIIIAAITISMLAAFSRELAIPYLAKELAKDPKNLAGDRANEMRPRFDNATDILFQGRTTSNDEMRIDQPNFRLPPSLDRYGTQLIAHAAFYREPTGNRPGGYLFKGVSEPRNLDEKPSLQLRGTPVIITRRDAPDWLSPGECFLVTPMTFEQMLGDMAFRQYASTWQLIRGLRNPSLNFGADVRVTIHNRIVQPLLDVTLLFLGLPWVVSRSSRNVFFALGLCMVIVTGFFLVVMGFQYLGTMSLDILPPALAAWAPLMIFVPAAIGLGDTMRE
jgi:lipopolysaccharide export system permease protein